MSLSSSELILNNDGSIYHLKLKPGEIARQIITVGDPERVDMVIKHFDSIEFDRRCREFRTVTGRYRNRRLSVISTGIGTDNIDIVFNELDALVNIDFQTRQIKHNKQSLQFFRIGTSGTLRAEIPIDSLLISTAAIGLGGLAHYYGFEMDEDECAISDSFSSIWNQSKHVRPYCSKGATQLIQEINIDRRFKTGITLTAPGFYGPQGRSIRLSSAIEDFGLLASWDHPFGVLSNLEMETAGIYFLAKMLGHQAVSFNALLANRANGQFSGHPTKTIELLIEIVLERISNLEFPT